MDTAELISASDFIKLKNTVDAEINRRSNTKSVGNMSSYLQNIQIPLHQKILLTLNISRK